ncbi:hypothetical protein AB0F85_32225, partial [Nocardia fluminea]|uniref:transposase n=1 Tax=Nocardia fluminea TaxID=134984 RepID=UPI00348CA3C9
MPKPYPKEFRDDVVRVARNREPGQQLKQIAADFGISESCLAGWLKAADVEDGAKPGTTATENAELGHVSQSDFRFTDGSPSGRASCSPWRRLPVIG